MAYDTTNLAGKRGGATIEENTGAVSYEAGLYRHPGSGEELVTLFDPLFGNAQSEGVARVGFVRVGDVPEGYVKAINIQHEENAAALNAQLPASAEDLKGVLARLSALEGANAALVAENADLKAATAPAEDATPATDAPAEDATPKDEAPAGDAQNETNNVEGK